MALGVYIHFPYCRKRCPYCDFDIHVRRRIPHEAYERAVLAELAARAPLFSAGPLVSIYFGGGTPSLWRPDSIARIIAATRARFPSAPDPDPGPPPEVTLEANPDDLPPGLLDAVRAAGVNRLSIGAQSFDPDRLLELGRLHGPDDTRRGVAGARAAGFDNVSLDLICGLPDQSPAALDADIDALLALGPDHVSIYQLTVEPRTPYGAFERRGTLILPDDSAQADLAERAEARLADAGFTHYEVSSFARPGRRAVHNSLYWNGGEWLGLGCAAHSFRRDGRGGARWATVKNTDAYMRGIRAGAGFRSTLAGGVLSSHEVLDEATLACESMWLGLRQLDDGIDRAAWAARFGSDPLDRFRSTLDPLVAGGLVELAPTRLRLTPRGALLADSVGQQFLAPPAP